MSCFWRGISVHTREYAKAKATAPPHLARAFDEQSYSAPITFSLAVPRFAEAGFVCTRTGTLSRVVLEPLLQDKD
jgi:hypothetical protein